MDNLSGFKLDDLVSDPRYNFLSSLGLTDDITDSTHDSLNATLDDSPYTQATFDTKYYDNNVYIETFKSNKQLSLMSLNIQSLPAKFDNLKELICELSLNDCTPDIICLQEIWTVSNSNLYPIPGYQPLVFTERTTSQGGGWHLPKNRSLL
jgi:hypothetical protein